MCIKCSVRNALITDATERLLDKSVLAKMVESPRPETESKEDYVRRIKTEVFEQTAKGAIATIERLSLASGSEVKLMAALGMPGFDLNTEEITVAGIWLLEQHADKTFENAHPENRPSEETANV